MNQVVSSTFKKRRDSALRFASDRRGFPEAAALSEPLYEQRERSGYRYLLEPERRRRLEAVRRIAAAYGLAFSCCREGMADLNTGSCDGQQLLEKRS